MKWSSCGVDEKNLIFTYKLDKVANTIILYENGNEVGKVENIEFYNGNCIKTYTFQAYDSNLKQNVAFTMNVIL